MYLFIPFWTRHDSSGRSQDDVRKPKTDTLKIPTGAKLNRTGWIGDERARVLMGFSVDKCQVMKTEELNFEVSKLYCMLDVILWLNQRRLFGWGRE